MNTLIHLRLSDNDFYFEKDIIVKNDNELLFDIIINESRKVLKEYKDTLSDDFEIDYVDSLINDYYSIELDHYYGDFSQQLDSYKLPYIKRNGEYKWNVRLQEVTVYEFLDTHNLLDERVINTGVYYAGGGAGDEAFSEILS